MTLRGHPFARSIRLFAWVLLALLINVNAWQFAHAGEVIPLPPDTDPATAEPSLEMEEPLLPLAGPGAEEMTLDEAAPEVMLTPVPQGTGTVTRVQVQGAQRIEPGSVLSYVLLRTGQPYDADAADRSLKALFDTGLFADVRLEWDGGILTVVVVENPILNQVVYEGNRAVSEGDLTREVQVRPRMVFTRARVQADVGRIIELFRRSGHFAATVEPKIIQRPQNRVDLVFEINEGPVTGVAAINFIGNTVFSDADLRQQVATGTSAWWKFLSTNDNYDPDRLTFDREQLRRFYLSRGYADFRVVSVAAELTPDRRDFFITFTVEEGQLYRFGKISLESQIRDLNPEILRPLLAVQEGDFYDATVVDRSIEALTFAAGTRGFVFVDISPRVVRDVENRLVELTFTINEAPRVYVERINIIGNARTRDEVIRREFRLAEGDAFNRVLSDRSRTRIRSLGFFSNVVIQEEPGSALDRTVLTVAVTEQPTGELSLGAGFSNIQGMLLDFAYTERNLFGRGQYLRSSVSIGIFQKTYDLRFTEPYFLGRPLAAGVMLYKVITNFSRQIGYISSVSAFGLNLGFPVSEYGRLSPHYNFQFTEISPVIGSSLAIQLAAGTYSTSALGYTYTYDTRDDIFLPNRGWNFIFSQDVAGFGGTLKFLRTVGQISYWHPWFFGLTANITMGSGFVSAFSGQAIPINERFFKGGPSFRGFRIAGVGPRDIVGNAALGGQFYAIGTYAVRLPQILPEDYGIRLSLFSDFGTLGMIQGAQNFCALNICVKDDLAMRVTAGLSVNWRSPFGPVEINIGHPIKMESYDKPATVQFTAGTMF